MHNYPARFISAVDKLIRAYADGTLYADSCKHCAVGNICNNNQLWYGLVKHPPSRYIKYKVIEDTGYSIKQLAKVEDIFMTIAPSMLNGGEGSVFDALVAIIDYLSQLDNLQLEQTEIFKDALKNKEQLCLTN